MSEISQKQVIVVRKDLKMRRGKEAAQVAHASVNTVKEYWHYKGVQMWLNEPLCRKIVVSVNSLKELYAVQAEAIAWNLINHLQVDQGLTEFHGQETITCLAVGPAPDAFIDQVTGNLPLR